MKNYWNSWNATRLLRLAFGFIIIIQGIFNREWMFVVLGGLFSLMPLFNVACCVNAGCKTRTQENEKSLKEITFDEVK